MKHVSRLLIAILACATVYTVGMRGLDSLDRWTDKAALREPQGRPRVFFETVPGPETFVPSQQQPTLVPETIDAPLPEPLPEQPPRSRLINPRNAGPRPDREI